MDTADHVDTVIGLQLASREFQGMRLRTASVLQALGLELLLVEVVHVNTGSAWFEEVQTALLLLVIEKSLLGIQQLFNRVSLQLSLLQHDLLSFFVPFIVVV